jgi:hypothetical protein
MSRADTRRPMSANFAPINLYLQYNLSFSSRSDAFSPWRSSSDELRSPNNIHSRYAINPLQ